MANKTDKNRFLGIRLEFIIALLLLIVTFAIYWEVKNHDFVSFDDGVYVTGNHYVKAGFTREGLIWAFSTSDTTYLTYWHPLTCLSHMLDFELYGLAPGMHHRTNLLIHIANVLLLFFLLKRMTGKIWQSAFVAALFAIHPINVDSVAWIAERKNLLSTFFALLTLLAYTSYANRLTLARYALTLFLFVLGLLSKPTVAILPFVFLLLDYWPLGRLQFKATSLHNQQNEHKKTKGPGIFSLVLEKVPFLVLSALAIHLASSSLRHSDSIIPTAEVSIGLRLANALVSIFRYIAKMIWPNNLSFYYPFPDSVPAWQVVTAVFFLAGIFIIMFRIVKKHPYGLIGWLWYLGMLLPVSGIMQAGLWPAIADRWAYMPLIGIYIIIAWGIPDLMARFRYKGFILTALSVTSLAFLGSFTHTQIQYWANSISLYRHALDLNPANFIAHNNIGSTYIDHHQTNLAIFHFKKAIELKPTYSSAHNNLANIYLEQGNYEKALTHFKISLSINPKSAEAHNNMGAALLKKGRISEAEAFFRHALELDPHNPLFYFNMALLFKTRGDFEMAKQNYLIVLQYSPEDTETHINLGDVLMDLRDFQGALQHYKIVLQIDPNNTAAKSRLEKATDMLKNNSSKD